MYASLTEWKIFHIIIRDEMKLIPLMVYEYVLMEAVELRRSFFLLYDAQKKHGLYRAFSFGMSLRGFSSLLCSPLLNIQNLGNVLQ